MKKISYLLLALIILAGLWFRWEGTKLGLSFWNDESNTALMSRGLLWYGKPVTPFGYGSGIYQIALYFVTAVSFKLFGISELAGRLPSVLAGSALIVVAFFVAKKMFGLSAALITTFLVSFSQIQLAWSTQLRPYIWLELLTLSVVYFCWRGNFFWAIAFCFLAMLFHTTGIISLGVVCLSLLIKCLVERKYIYLLAVGCLALIAPLVVYFSFHDLTILFKIDTNILHYRIFLTHNYWWLFLGAGVGGYLLWKKDKVTGSFLTMAIIAIFSLAIFKVNSQYVRYSLPAFPLLYLLFGYGFVRTVRRLHLAIVLLIIPVLMGKILLMPQAYYSINADVRENPIVDYKAAFIKIGQLIANKKDIVVMDAWNDRVPWYFPEQKFIFLVDGKGRSLDEVYGEKMVGTVPEFEQQKAEYPSGIVIVENWPSLTPPALRAHVRTTLKHEFDTNTVTGNENDPWSISVYSWGI